MPKLESALQGYNQSNFDVGSTASLIRHIASDPGFGVNQHGLTEDDLAGAVKVFGDEHRSRMGSGFTEGSNYKEIARNAVRDALSARGISNAEFQDRTQPWVLGEGVREAQTRWEGTQKDDGGFLGGLGKPLVLGGLALGGLGLAGYGPFAGMLSGAGAAGAAAAPFGEIAAAEAALAAESAGALGVAGGATAGGSMMPSAIVDPAVSEAISSGVLQQTAPGVFENVGNIAAFGASLNPQAANALNLGGGNMIQTPPAAQPATGPGAAQSAAATPSMPPAQAPAPPGSVAGPGASSAGGQTSFVDSLIKQMKDNALGLGLVGGSTLLSLGNKPKLPNEQQIQGLGNEASGIARQLIAQYQSGTLSPGQQASLDQMAQNTKNQLRNYFASIGQGDSTAAVQSMAQVDQAVEGMKQEMLDNALAQGLSAIGIAQGPLNTIAQYELAQDQQLKQAFGNFATGVGTLFGRQAGTPQQPQQQTAAPTITSAR